MCPRIDADGVPQCTRQGCPSYVKSGFAQVQPSECVITGKKICGVCIPYLREMYRGEIVLAERRVVDAAVEFFKMREYSSATYLHLLEVAIAALVALREKRA